jgi:hypothetical protein
MQRKRKRRPDACAAERRRAAPHTRPAGTPAATFPLVSAIPGNGLRSRCSWRQPAPPCPRRRRSCRPSCKAVRARR